MIVHVNGGIEELRLAVAAAAMNRWKSCDTVWCGPTTAIARVWESGRSHHYVTRFPDSWIKDRLPIAMVKSVPPPLTMKLEWFHMGKPVKEHSYVGSFVVESSRVAS